MIDAPTTCTRHTGRETALSCGKCGRPFCSQCLVQTPVGLRCKECAGNTRAVGASPLVLLRAAAAGLAASTVAWLLVYGIPYLRFFLAIVVGAAVGEVVDRMGRKRRGLALEVAAGAAVLGGIALSVVVGRLLWGDVHVSTSGLIYTLGLPALIAVVVAVVKVRP